MVNIFAATIGRMGEFVQVNQVGLSVAAVTGLFFNAVIELFLIVWPFFLFGFIITFLVTVYQVGWKISTKTMEPKLSKFNPISGFKRIISKDSLFELVKSIPIRFTFTVEGQQVQNLFSMTPHVFRIGKAGAQRLAKTEVLTDTASCVLNVYRRS